MSFLKKLGAVVLKIVGIETGLLPLIQSGIQVAVPGNTSAGAVVAKVDSEFQKVVSVITTAEQMFTAASGPDAKTGADKLKAATPFVAGLIQQSEIMVGKKVKDSAKFETAVTAITSAFADLLNSVEAN